MANLNKYDAVSWRMDVGVNHTPAYQVSGRPFAKGNITTHNNGAVKVTFPYVTRWIYVINHDQTKRLRVGFSELGVLGTSAEGSCYFELPKADLVDKGGGASVRLELKVSEIWLSGSNAGDNGIADVIAGLTSILPPKVKTNSGPSWSGSVGVG